MSNSRRDFLTLGGLAGLSLVATSCAAASRGMAQLDLADSLALPPVGSLNVQLNSSYRRRSYAATT